MEGQNKMKLVVQYNFASTSEMDWEPPITSTPVPVVQQQSYTVIRERRLGMLQNFQISKRLRAAPLENFNNPSPVMKKNHDSSVFSKTNRSKSRGFLVSDSSSDEEEFINKNKKLVIKIQSNEKKANEVPMKKNKRSLKMKSVDKNVDLKHDEVLKKEDLKDAKVKSRNLRSNNVANISIKDKENLCNDVEQESEKPKKKGYISSKIPVKCIPVKKKNDAIVKSLPKVVPEKRKCTKNSSGAKKSKLEEPLKTIEEENVNYLDKSKNSSSHQLFSKAREEEFLESVDLTAVEVEEPNKTLNESVQKKKEKKCTRKRSKISKKENEVKVKGCELNIQESEVEVKNHKLDNKESEVMKEDQIEEKNVDKNSPVPSDRPVRCRKPPKQFWIPNENNEAVKDETASSSSSSSKIPKRDRKKVEANKDSGENLSIEYFKNIKDLKFKESATGGYSNAECFFLSHFKCAVLKIGNKAKAASKTSRKNSALGGVVLQGTIKMKIGDVEKVIQAGETIFVPPLTEWSAVNLGEKECIIYYWSGLF